MEEQETQLLQQIVQSQDINECHAIAQQLIEGNKDEMAQQEAQGAPQEGQEAPVEGQPNIQEMFAKKMGQ